MLSGCSNATKYGARLEILDSLNHSPDNHCPSTFIEQRRAEMSKQLEPAKSRSSFNFGNSASVCTMKIRPIDSYCLLHNRSNLLCTQCSRVSVKPLVNVLFSFYGLKHFPA